MGDNGLALSNFDPLVDALEKLETANAEPPTGMILAPGMEIALARLREATGDAPLPIPPALGEVTLASAIQIPTNVGTGTNESLVIGGGFCECWIGIRMAATVEILRELYMKNYQYAYLVSLRADVQLAHAVSFCKLTGITP
jgi:HK97 family phage major capsid protein